MAAQYVPEYITFNKKQKLERQRLRCQLELPFPPPTLLKFPAPLPAWKEVLRNRQPARFPRGWHRMAMADPDWRRAYALRWIAARKDAGLPCVITEPLYLIPLEKTA